MKRLLISVAVLGLLGGAPALADNDHHHGQGQGGGGGNPHDNGGGNPKGEVVPGSNGIFDKAAGRTGHGNGGQNGSGGPAVSNGSAMQGTNGDRHHDNGRWQGGGNNGNNGNAHGNATNWQGGNWGNANNNWRGGATHWHGGTWHGNGGVTITGRNFDAQRHFHAGSYHRPSGWYYRRWSYGERLPAAFFLSSYWLTNYFAFGLDSPPPGLVWVRYGDDALLVDRYTGEIVEVEYGVFY